MGGSVPRLNVAYNGTLCDVSSSGVVFIRRESGDIGFRVRMSRGRLAVFFVNRGC